MSMTTLIPSTGATLPFNTGAAAANPYFTSAASPNSLASIMRNSVLIRDPREPISFPFQATEVVGYDRRY